MISDLISFAVFTIIMFSFNKYTEFDRNLQGYDVVVRPLFGRFSVGLFQGKSKIPLMIHHKADDQGTNGIRAAVKGFVEVVP